MRSIQIAGRHIGPNHTPSIIGNHNPSLERALEIVEVAAKTGAHALKIQALLKNIMIGNTNTKEINHADIKY